MTIRWVLSIVFFMKRVRIITILCIAVIYSIFSQFSVKAFLTTDFSPSWDPQFCVNEKLDTFEWKRSCWKTHTMTDLSVVEIEPVWESHHINPFFCSQAFCPYALWLWDGPLAQWPPPTNMSDLSKSIFIETYIWLTLLLF